MGQANPSSSLIRPPVCNPHPERTRPSSVKQTLDTIPPPACAPGRDLPKADPNGPAAPFCTHFPLLTKPANALPHPTCPSTARVENHCIFWVSPKPRLGELCFLRSEKCLSVNLFSKHNVIVENTARTSDGFTFTSCTWGALSPCPRGSQN